MSVLSANPVLMLVLGVSWPFAIAVPMCVAVLLQWLWRERGMSLVTVYAVNFVAIGGVWLHAEVLVRTRFHDYVMEDLYLQHGAYYFNRPFLKSQLTDKEYAADYITNVDGFRIGHSQDPARTVGAVDWLFLGDSYTQGAQVAFEDLFTTRLYRAFPDRVILNAGISGWGLHESLAYLRASGRRHRPQVVFLQVANFNDFMKVVPRRAGVSDYLMEKSEAVRLILQDIKYRNPTDLPLGRWVEPFYASEEENRRYNVFYSPTSEEKREDLRSVGSVIRELALECRRLDARLVLLSIPTKEQVSFTYLEEVLTGLAIDPRLLDMDRPNAILRSIADSLGVSLIDPLSEWRRAEQFPFYRYDEHLTAVGHEMLAASIEAFLRAAGETTTVRMLSTTYSGDRYPQFVPTGDSIVFHSPRGGHAELVHADIATWTESQLTIGDASVSHPILVPPLNDLIFAAGDAEEGTTQLWRSDRSGRAPKRLEGNDAVFGSIPAAFPDGMSIVYPSWGPEPNASSVRLTRYYFADERSEYLPQATDRIWRPTVHPTGRYVAYIGLVGKQYEVFELDLATRRTARLTNTPYDEWDPAWSPDGSTLIYAARIDDNWDLVRHPRGGAPVRHTSTRGDEWDPQVAPDGSAIAFGGEYGIMRGIYLMSLPR